MPGDQPGRPEDKPVRGADCCARERLALVGPAARVGSVRIATWNVNSVKQRVPRLLPWLDERQPDVVCLQETKLADDAFAELLGDELADARLRGRRSRRGDVERRGDPLARGAGGRRAGTPRRAGLPASGGARGVRHVRRDPGGLGVRAERARAGLRALRVQARLAGRAAGDGRRRPGGDGRLRRHEHRADRRRRVRPGRLRRPDPRHAARARGAGGAAGARPARRRARPLAGRAGVHLLGLPGGDVPPGPRDADRPGAGQRAGRRPRAGGVGGPAGAQGQRARAITRR